MNPSIRTIKKFFLIIGSILIFLLISGSFYFKDSEVITGRLITAAFTAILYDIETNTTPNIPDMINMLMFGKKNDPPEGPPAQSIPVLVYHGIVGEYDGSNINLTKEQFRNQMFALKKAGYYSIGIADFYTYMRGQKSLPGKPILITFDDGRVDSFDVADSVLRALGFKAVMFAIAKVSIAGTRNSYYLNESELKAMERSGRWEIESHSDKAHEPYPVDNEGHTAIFNGNKLWVPALHRLETDEEFGARVAEDFQSSRQKIERLLQRSVTAYAFPFGDFGQHDTNFPGAKNIVLENARHQYDLLFFQGGAGFRFRNNYSTAATHDEETILSKRIIVNGGWNGEQLLAALKLSEAKDISYGDDFSTDKGWVNAWGLYTIENGNMILAPFTPEDTGSAVVLDGTRAWSDYSVSLTVESPSQSGVYLWVRFQDDYNHAGCNFGNGFVHIEQTLNGESRTIKGVVSPDLKIPAGIFTIGARANGRSVTCFINDVAIVESSFVQQELLSGGIGVKTWDATPGLATLFVKKVQVSRVSKPE
jgi:peptidoglycan/xylan/chitin deacetylase (PgdA/CDA1 family)